MRLRRFAAAAVTCIGLALGISGCGGHSRHTPTPGTLSIYTSLPFEGPYAAAAVANYDAEELALAQAGGTVNGTKVVLRRLDDAAPGTGSNAALVAQSARIAAGDVSTIAYIGELTPGSSSESIPTLSQAGILQVSPGDTATGLAGATFARVVPPDSAEADAQLAALHKLGVNRVYLLEDRTTHGRDIATAVLGDASAYGLVVVDAGRRYLRPDTRALVRAIKKSKAGGLLYAGSPGPSLAAFWNALSAADGTIRKMASAPIADSASWAQTTAAARDNTYLSAPGLLPNRGLPRAGTQFENDFLSAYGNRVRWTSGIFGYVAMSGVLTALHSLGPHVKNLRAKLADAFLHIKDVPSALGTYSMVDGQTTFRNYLFTTYPKGSAVPSYDAQLG